MLRSVVSLQVSEAAKQPCDRAQRWQPAVRPEVRPAHESLGSSDVAAAAVPRAVAAIVRRRLARLREPVVVSLHAAAVIGREFSAGALGQLVLACVPEVPAAALPTMLAEATSAAVLVRTAASEFASRMTCCATSCLSRPPPSATGLCTSSGPAGEALLAELADLGWNKALDASEHDDPAIRAREALDIQWWLQQASSAVERYGML